jgi:septum site-determining protein MinC
MSSLVPDPPSSGPLEIKSGSVNLLTLKLSDGNLDRVSSQLNEKVRNAPDFFRNAPVVIELSALNTRESTLDFGRLTSVLRQVGLSPVGVRGGHGALNQAAEAAGLAVLAERRNEPPQREASKTATPAKAEPPAPTPSGGNTRLIDQPVRSGQRLYAAGGDMIVLAPVSPGAELLADGNIHIYSSLRGRALAGVQGNLSSRIFCMDLQAELIAIGGHYQISENLEESIRGKPVQVFLRDGALIIEDL